MAGIFVIEVRGRKLTVLVEFGDTIADPGHLCVRYGSVWLPILSCTSWEGDELRDDLTARNLRELEDYLGAGV